MSLDRALELAGAAPGVAYPNPTVGAVVVAADGVVVGEGVTEAHGGRHGEVVALAAAGESCARGHALRDDGAVRPSRADAAVRRRDRRRRRRARRRRLPRPEPRSRGRPGAAPCRPVSTPSSTTASRHAARTRPGAPGRPSRAPSSPTRSRRPSTGASRCPGARWVTGEASRRLVHELRAASDAVAVGHGDRARRRAAARRAGRPGRAAAAPARVRQRAAAARLRASSSARARFADELATLAAEGVQSLLLEGGPTLATAFLEAGLVDKLLVFVAPTLSGDGPRFLGDLSAAEAAASRLGPADRETIC